MTSLKQLIEENTLFHYEDIEIIKNGLSKTTLKTSDCK